MGVFFYNDTATTEIYTLSLHDALPICALAPLGQADATRSRPGGRLLPRATLPHPRRRPRHGEFCAARYGRVALHAADARRSEEHTSELQSRQYLVCRLLLEKKKNYRLT